MTQCVVRKTFSTNDKDVSIEMGRGGTRWGGDVRATGSSSRYDKCNPRTGARVQLFVGKLQIYDMRATSPSGFSSCRCATVKVEAVSYTKCKAANAWSSVRYPDLNHMNPYMRV